MLGEPSLATTKSSSLSAGFAGAQGGGVAVAGLAGSTDSLSRTHCVQQAEITYEQPFELQPVAKGRVNDVAGSVLLGFVGLSVMIAAKIRSQTIFEPGDPLYEPPPSPTGGYLVGGAMIAGGVGLLVYSFGSLPKGPKPQVQASAKRWQQVELVEATGCTSPNDSVARQTPTPAATTQTPAPAANDTAARLQRLDQLRAAGTITEAEYQ
ncbi:MAG TPA: SHOCT domain-containing protein, partial [Kofleriaceae bacterium]